MPWILGRFAALLLVALAAAAASGRAAEPRGHALAPASVRDAAPRVRDPHPAPPPLRVERGDVAPRPRSAERCSPAIGWGPEPHASRCAGWACPPVREGTLRHTSVRPPSTRAPPAPR